MSANGPHSLDAVPLSSSSSLVSVNPENYVIVKHDNGNVIQEENEAEVLANLMTHMVHFVSFQHIVHDSEDLLDELELYQSECWDESGRRDPILQRCRLPKNKTSDELPQPRRRKGRGAGRGAANSTSSLGTIRQGRIGVTVTNRRTRIVSTSSVGSAKDNACSFQCSLPGTEEYLPLQRKFLELAQLQNDTVRWERRTGRKIKGVPDTSFVRKGRSSSNSQRSSSASRSGLY